ncbi:MAG TPA: rod shape-determining protein MreC [Gammaproteobacteria bacterium]|nr:rod shape-determining protein MreC [Gammaproteobacteria bacterium]
MACAFALMVFDKNIPATEHIRTALSLPLAPLQYIVSAPIQLIDKLNQLASTQDALRKENIDLKAQQLLLKAELQRLVAIESENNRLKGLLQSSKQIHGKMIVAQLLAVNSDLSIRQIVLDKGFHDGVFVGQPVLDASGVMGQVMQVSPLTSRVLLINDPKSGVAVECARNGIRAIAMGDSYSGRLRLANVPHTADIRSGDMFLTSGLSDRYPPGYPVGKVVSVTRDPGKPFAIITLEPSARLDQSRQVLLVWPKRTY